MSWNARCIGLQKQRPSARALFRSGNLIGSAQTVTLPPDDSPDDLIRLGAERHGLFRGSAGETTRGAA